MRYYLFYFCFCLWGLTAAHAQSPMISISGGEQMQRIGTEIQVLEDPSGKLQFSQVRSAVYQNKFQPHEKEVFKTPATESVFWIRFTARNESNQDIWFEIGDPYSTWYADFYAPDPEGNYGQPIELGALRPAENKRLPSSYYCVRLAEDQQIKTYYLRIQGFFPKAHLFQVGTTKAIVRHHNRTDYIVAGFTGLMIAMILYNLFLFLSITNRLYLYYILYLAFLLPEVPFNLGYPFFDDPWFWEYAHLWRNMDTVFATLFTVSYLRLKRQKKYFSYLIWITTALLALVLPALNLLGVSFIVTGKLYVLFLLLYSFSLLFIGIYVWLKHMKTARFYVLAWSAPILGIILHILTLNAVLPYNFFTHHIVFFGFALETLLFALALGDRYRLIKQEKEFAQAENLRITRNQNRVLEDKVKERTEELKQKQEEILTQNEELRQAQEELQTQRDFLDEQNQALDNQNRKVATSIRAAHAIQRAVLPKEEKLSRLLGEYFVLNRPRDVVSGDFYRLDQIGGKTIWITADCTGHGVPGAFMTMIGNSLLDRIIRLQGIHEPARILEHLDQELRTALQQENVGIDMTVTCWEKASENTLKVSFAGAKSSLLYAQPNDKSLSRLRGTRRSVGGKRKSLCPFQTHELELLNGSLLYAGSDGLRDQNNKNREKFGSPRLEQVLNNVLLYPLSKQKRHLEQQLDAFMEGCEQRDDILWMAVRL